MYTLQDFIDGNVCLKLTKSKEDIFSFLQVLDALGITYSSGRNLLDNILLPSTINGLTQGVIVEIKNHKTMTSLVNRDKPVVDYKDLIQEKVEEIGISLDED